MLPRWQVSGKAISIKIIKKVKCFQWILLHLLPNCLQNQSSQILTATVQVENSTNFVLGFQLQVQDPIRALCKGLPDLCPRSPVHGARSSSPGYVPVPLCKISAVEVSEMQRRLWRENFKVVQRNRKGEEDHTILSPGESVRGEMKGMSHSKNYCRGFPGSCFDALVKGRQRKRGKCQDCKIIFSHGRFDVAGSHLSLGWDRRRQSHSKSHCSLKSRSLCSVSENNLFFMNNS